MQAGCCKCENAYDKAAQHLAHALGESVAGGNPGIPYAFSHPACITSHCPYKLTYFPRVSRNFQGSAFPEEIGLGNRKTIRNTDSS